LLSTATPVLGIMAADPTDMLGPAPAASGAGAMLVGLAAGVMAPPGIVQPELGCP